jgi:hypothetical protein
MRRLTSLAAGILVTVCVREAAAQKATFGIGMGGMGTAFVRTAALDARLHAAGRNGVGGLAGGFTFPFDASIGPFRLAASLDGFFGGNDPTRSIQGFSGSLLIGARVRHDRWVFSPSMGPSLTSTSLCVKGPPGATPSSTGPLFDQILSAAGPGECLVSDVTGMKFELGIDRELIPPSDDPAGPSFYIGLRAGVTLPLEARWRWGEQRIEGPLAPMITPSLHLVMGFRLRIGE